MSFSIYPSVLVRDLENKKLLLGYKKHGFDRDKWGFFGNEPVQENESDLESAIRQTNAETGLEVSDLKRVGYLIIQVGTNIMAGNLYVTSKFKGQIKENDEVKPEWFDENNLPKTHRWLDDKYWLEHVLANKFVQMHFVYTDSLDVLLTHEVEVFKTSEELEDSLKNVKYIQDQIAQLPYGYCG